MRNKAPLAHDLDVDISEQARDSIDPPLELHDGTGAPRHHDRVAVHVVGEAFLVVGEVFDFPGRRDRPGTAPL